MHFHIVSRDRQRRFLCRSRLLAAGVSAIGLFASSTSFAQDGPSNSEQQASAKDDQPRNEASRSGLSTIVVTARRQEEDLQSTPISISAFDSEAISQRNIQTAADITNFAPNVQFDSVASESGGGASSQISIRGIGQTDYVLTVEPTVGIYLDGIYIGKSIGSLLDTVDVERIEVLRGPQGTLFGKNTIGGAIQLVSRRPSDEWGGYAEFTTGSFDRADAKLALTGPISDSLRFRVSGASLQRDGHVNRLDLDGNRTGVTEGKINRLTGRFALEADITNDIRATLAVDATRIRENSAGQVTLVADETGFFNGIFNSTVPGGACLPSAGDARFSNPVCNNSQFELELDSRANFNAGPNLAETDVFGASLTVEADLGWATLKSISAYREVDVEIAQDLSASPSFASSIEQSIQTEQYSQELQLLGEAFGDRLNYVLGLYYLKEKGRQEFPVRLPLLQFLSGGEIDNDSYAAFGQATFDLTDQLSITGGLRYTDETRRFDPTLQEILGYEYLSNVAPIEGLFNPLVNSFGPPGTDLFPPGQYSRSDSSLTYMASLNWQPTDDILAYASYAKGFKGGGFTLRYIPPVVAPPGVDPDDLIGYAGPETAGTYEIGLKTDLFDRRLRFNVAGFYTDYEDIQITYNVAVGEIMGFLPVLDNAGTAEIKGIEIETTALVTPWLQIDGAFGYIDAEYTEFSQLAIDNLPNIEQLEIPNTPKYTLALGATGTFFDDERGRARVRVDYSYRSGQFKDFANTQSIFQPSYDLLNASLTYTSASEQWEISAGATNITDEAYIVSGFANDGVIVSYGVVSRPREWFLRGRFSF